MTDLSRKWSSGAAIDSQLHMNAQQPLSKRMRAGSITGRLRTASDLEDSGFINKSEKGFLKDLIISGDAALQEALDKYERGDQSELAIICKSLSGRRHSIDILENLDLDFTFLANNEMNFGSDSLDDTDDPIRNSLLGRMSDFAAPVEVDLDNWRPRRSSISSVENIFRSVGGEFDDSSIHTAPAISVSENMALLCGRPTLGEDVLITTLPSRRISKSTIDPNIFETQVDLNAYSAHAEMMGLGGARESTGTRTSARSAAQSRSLSSRKGSYAAYADPYSSMLGSNRNIDSMFAGTGLGLVWAKAAPDGRYIGGEAGYVGAYSPEQRKKRIERFLEKRSRRVWTKKVKVCHYDIILRLLVHHLTILTDHSTTSEKTLLIVGFE